MVEETDGADGWDVFEGGPARAGGLVAAYSSSEDSYFAASASESEDSAEVRRREADRKLKDFGTEAEEEATSSRPLPTALAAFDEVGGPPAFLDPDATRPLARGVHGRQAPQQAAEVEPEAAVRRKGKTPPTAGWDIASMAPRMKGQRNDGLPEGAVISAAPQRYKTEDRVMVTAAQIAMLGGIAPEEQDQHDKGKVKSKAMPVEQFLDKGVGGALLPRKRQDRKEKEQSKRAKGQSGVQTWKSEAEMVLRQQYD